MKIINRQVKLVHGEKINVKFVIKEEERIIIAIVKFKDYDDVRIHKLIKEFDRSDNDNSNDERIVINWLENVCRDFGFIPTWTTTVQNRLTMNSLYTSTAKCDPRDEWNEEVGMSIVTEKITKNYL